MLFKVLAGLVLLGVSLVAPYTSEAGPNEPAGFTTYFECSFNNTLCGMFSVYGTQPYGSDSSEPASPSGYLAERVEPGAVLGNGQWELNFSPVKEIYVDAMWSPGST